MAYIAGAKQVAATHGAHNLHPIGVPLVAHLAHAHAVCIGQVVGNLKGFTGHQTAADGQTAADRVIDIGHFVGGCRSFGFWVAVAIGVAGLHAQPAPHIRLDKLVAVAVGARNLHPVGEPLVAHLAHAIDVFQVVACSEGFALKRGAVDAHFPIDPVIHIGYCRGFTTGL